MNVKSIIWLLPFIGHNFITIRHFYKYVNANTCVYVKPDDVWARISPINFKFVFQRNEMFNFSISLSKSQYICYGNVADAI